jgi:hypothetical protein
MEVSVTIESPTNIKSLEFPLNHLTIPDVIIKAPKALVKGHGL